MEKVELDDFWDFASILMLLHCLKTSYNVY